MFLWNVSNFFVRRGQGNYTKLLLIALRIAFNLQAHTLGEMNWIKGMCLAIHRHSACVWGTVSQLHDRVEKNAALVTNSGKNLVMVGVQAETSPQETCLKCKQFKSYSMRFEEARKWLSVLALLHPLFWRTKQLLLRIWVYRHIQLSML